MKAAYSFSFQKEFPCPYFRDGRKASVEYIVLPEEAPQRFHELLRKGCRRSGTLFYRNVCLSCSACMPLRLETEFFTFTKSQRRTMNRNMDIRVESHSSFALTPEKVALYRKYLTTKHAEEEVCDYETLLSIIHFGYRRTIEMDYYLGKRLIGVGIVDEADDALSSNYFYYDTDFPQRRFGIFSLLQEISLARHLGKKYCYLGFCIEENRKMSYKKFFRPNQILRHGKWMTFLE